MAIARHSSSLRTVRLYLASLSPEFLSERVSDRKPPTFMLNIVDPSSESTQWLKARNFLAR